jgi:hypothetical protein
VAWAWECGGPLALALHRMGLAGVVAIAGGGCFCGLSVAGSSGGSWAMCCVPGQAAVAVMSCCGLWGRLWCPCHWGVGRGGHCCCGLSRVDTTVSHLDL